MMSPNIPDSRTESSFCSWGSRPIRLVLRESAGLHFRGLGLVQGSIKHLLSKRGYGPPPAYPNLKIPGLNAPIPQAGFRTWLCWRAYISPFSMQGAEYGYHPGGWGKPPVDELVPKQVTLRRQ